MNETSKVFKNSHDKGWIVATIKSGKFWLIFLPGLLLLIGMFIGAIALINDLFSSSSQAGMVEPPPSDTGKIVGMVWKDVCVDPGTGEAVPGGCLPATGDLGLMANGLKDISEDGIQGIRVSLGAGSCPSGEIASTITGTDGYFGFHDLASGVYCLSVDPASLGEGAWTYPTVGVGEGFGSRTIVLTTGEIVTDANFGWGTLQQPPALTPEPTSTPTPLPTPIKECQDRLSILADVTIPDGTRMDPGEKFRKTWRLRNSGSCTWTNDYALVFISGYQMLGPEVARLPGEMKPGDVVDVSLNLQSPTANGTYRGYWMLRNENMGFFGYGEGAKSPFWVEIKVGPEPTPQITEWRGEYFTNRKLEGDPALVRNDKNIDFNWQSKAPASGLPVNDFSVRWTREVKFDAAIYRFSVEADDGVRLWVDDRMVIDLWKDSERNLGSVDLALTKGNHDLKLEYYEHSGNALAYLGWEKIDRDTYSDWLGKYWFNRDRDSAWALVRSETAIDFDWGSGSPAPGIQNDNFSARWQREVKFDPGLYRFSAFSDDGMLFYLDGKLAIDEWHASGGSETYSVEYELEGRHDLELVYYEATGKAKIKFWWEKIGSINHPPSAADDAYQILADTTLNVAAPGVLGNDTDSDGDSLTAALVIDANNGTLVLNANGSFTYQPNAGFTGVDSFTYRAKDAKSESNQATVRITVEKVDVIPTAVEDEVTIDEDTQIEIPVMANDQGLGDAPIVITSMGTPANGSVEKVGALIRYTPNLNFNGDDSFTYTIEDFDGDQSSALVTVHVTPIDDPPQAVDDSYAVQEDEVLTVLLPGVLKNDLEVDGDPLTIVLQSGTIHGALTLKPDGSFTYQPETLFHGEDSFTYLVNDGSTDSNIATVKITIEPNTMP
jgi:hypothetical protein